MPRVTGTLTQVAAGLPIVNVADVAGAQTATDVSTALSAAEDYADGAVAAIPDATASAKGLATAAQITRLNGIEAGAQVNLAVGTTPGTVAAGDDSRLGTINVTTSGGTVVAVSGMRGVARQYVNGTLDTRRPSATNQAASDVLLSTILEAAPNAIAQVYLGDSLGAVGADVASWPAANFGGTALTHQGAASAYTVGVDEKTGHKYALSTTSEDRSLVIATGTYLSTIVVYSTEEYNSQAVTMLAFTSVSIYPLFCNQNLLHLETQSGTGEPTQWIDGVESPGGAPLMNDGRPHVYEGQRATNNIAGITIGGRLENNVSPRGKIFAVILLREVLTTAQRTAITDALLEHFEVPGPHALILDGNSIAAGHPNTFPTTPSRSVLVPGVAVYNLAISATTIDEAIARMAASFAKIRFDACLTKWVWFYEICNALAPGTGNQTDVQVLASLRAYVTGIRALGCKVLMSTCMPASHVTAPTAEGYRVAVNTVLRAQTWGAACDYGDALIDFAALTIAQNTGNTVYFRDAVHPTDYFYSVMWAMIRNKHASLISD